MTDDYQPQIRSVDDVPPDNRRGGDLRVLLSPKSVGCTAGYMGVATIGPRDWIAEHYHPFSEEFIYVASGSIVAELDGVRYELPAGHVVFIPMNVRHRLRNEGDEEAVFAFICAPIAPRPAMGHVDTEQRQPTPAPAS
jgi:putative monooxygenase